MSHTFHIPVLGLGFSVETPVKVAKFGISSVASIVDDMLIERMRKYHSELRKKQFFPIEANEPDSRARRIMAYLNLMHKIVKEDFEEIKNQPFEPLSDITRYFELLPESSVLKMQYRQMLKTCDQDEKEELQNALRQQMTCGSIDVNIMAKVDKLNLPGKTNLPEPAVVYPSKEPLDNWYSGAPGRDIYRSDAEGS